MVVTHGQLKQEVVKLLLDVVALLVKAWAHQITVVEVPNLVGLSFRIRRQTLQIRRLDGKADPLDSLLQTFRIRDLLLLEEPPLGHLQDLLLHAALLVFVVAFGTVLVPLVVFLQLVDCLLGSHSSHFGTGSFRIGSLIVRIGSFRCRLGGILRLFGGLGIPVGDGALGSTHAWMVLYALELLVVAVDRAKGLATSFLIRVVVLLLGKLALVLVLLGSVLLATQADAASGLPTESRSLPLFFTDCSAMESWVSSSRSESDPLALRSSLSDPDESRRGGCKGP